MKLCFKIIILQFRVRLFWVKMISGNHFHHFPHVWLSWKISFSGKWLPVDQYFHLWPGNQFLPSFSLQITSGKREREREKREPRSEREREERATIALARSTIDDHDRRDRAARSSIYRRDRRDRVARLSIARRDQWDHAARSMSALVERSSLVGARRTHTARRRDRRTGCISFAGFWFLLPDLMHFL